MSSSNQEVLSALKWVVWLKQQLLFWGLQCVCVCVSLCVRVSVCALSLILIIESWGLMLIISAQHHYVIEGSCKKNPLLKVKLWALDHSLSKHTVLS